MRKADHSYWEARAEAQLRLAGLAEDDRVARAHSLLAGYYFDRAHNLAAKDIVPSEVRPSEHPLTALVRLVMLRDQPDPSGLTPAKS